MSVLEFLAWKCRTVDEYRAHLDRMLQLCSRPPLLERSSDTLTRSVIMEHYFTLLGYLLTIVPREEQIQRIRDALDSLLIERARPAANVAAARLDFRLRAMENSRLPVIVAELLEAATPKVYPKLLELAFTLASVSRQCCE
ncbi:uncharacterized protein LOC112588192 [Harpegnathos saltator]|uniref:uncharacterized protein LOC112588192 n=1 Tax=Harpegnathos saltator TaxID=610380 RepID=UPI000DBEE494|nr:uncharacterized protein LOC112588192 [Harpegnathos saltator]